MERSLTHRTRKERSASQPTRTRLAGPRRRAAIALLGLLIGISISQAGAPAPGRPVRHQRPTSGPGATRPAGQTQTIRYGPGRKIATLVQRQIRESSGLACSRRKADVFWTHNDSGGGARIFAFDLRGRALGIFTVPGASARDWEDMASFVMDRKSYLLLADTGDNQCRRRFSTLHLVEEPRIPAAAGTAAHTAKLVWSLRFAYEDGSYDCESVAVDPARRMVYLVTKRPKCAVYELPIPAKPTAAVRTAKRIAPLALGWFTAMDLSPDGLRAVLLTYGDALEFVRRPSENWSRGFARQPRVLPMPRRAQGESICYGSDGRTLYLTSEKLPTPLFQVPALPGRRQGAATAPAASPPARRREKDKPDDGPGGA